MNKFVIFLRPTLCNVIICRLLSLGESVTSNFAITKEDLESFARISGDTNPIHFESSQKAIVHGAFLNGLVSGVIGTKLPGPGTIVVSQNLNFPNKCFADEVVSITVKLVELRKIAKVEFVCRVEDQNKVVLHGDARLIILSPKSCT